MHILHVLKLYMHVVFSHDFLVSFVSIISASTCHLIVCRYTWKLAISTILAEDLLTVRGIVHVANSSVTYLYHFLDHD